MTLEHSPQSDDLSSAALANALEIGASHGYRIEGDSAFINAELSVPPQSAAGVRSLELWACERPYEAGALSGTKIAAVDVDLAPPFGTRTHQVEAYRPARLPLQGRTYAMVLALLQQDGDGQPRVQAFANYANPEVFTAPHFTGDVRHEVQGEEVVLEADGLFNPRAMDNLSGSLAVELLAFSASDERVGVRLAIAELPPLAGQSQLDGFHVRAAFSEPPVGRYRLALQLCEWTAAHGYVARDRRDLDALYVRREPEQAPAAEPTAEVAVAEIAVAEAAVVVAEAPSVEAAAVETAAVEAAAVEAVAVEAVAVEAVAVEAVAAEAVAVEAVAAEAVAVEAVAVEAPAVEAVAAEAVVAEAPVAAAPVVEVAASGADAADAKVSIQTAPVEVLAKVPGLNPKLAQGIVKARPYTSLDQLSRVRGIGQKTRERLKKLLEV